MTCRVTDFLKVGADEQRLIDAFGPTGGQSSYSRLRQDASESRLRRYPGRTIYHIAGTLPPSALIVTRQRRA